jgi:HEAT repeat protein
MASEKGSDSATRYPTHFPPSSALPSALRPPVRRNEESPELLFADKLLAALEHPLPEVRERAAVFLGSVGGPEARGPLLSLAKESPDAYLAEAALRGLRAHEHAWPELERIDWVSFTRPGHSIIVRVRAMEFLNEDRQSAAK